MSKKYEDTRQLPVALTEHELLDFGQQLARANTEHLAAEERKKLTNQQLKGDVDAKAARVSQLTSIVSSREEVRPVKCAWTMDLPKRGKKSLIRLDTQAVVESRDMVGDDMQPELEPIVKEAEQQTREVRDVSATVVLGLPAPGKSEAGHKVRTNEPLKPARKKGKAAKPAKEKTPGTDWAKVKMFYLAKRAEDKAGAFAATIVEFQLNKNTLKSRIQKEKWND